MFKIFLNPTHGVKFVFNCIVLRNFIGVCCLSCAWQGGVGASVSWSDPGLETRARHRLCQGAIYVLVGCGLVWYQELLGETRGHRCQDLECSSSRLSPGEAGQWPVTSDHRTLHPGAMSAVWEIFCSESSQTRKIFLSCRNIKRILIWYLVKYKVSVWFLCMQIWPYFLTQSLVRWLEIERLSKRLGVTDEEKSKHTSFQQLSVRL